MKSLITFLKAHITKLEVMVAEADKLAEQGVFTHPRAFLEVYKVREMIDSLKSAVKTLEAN